MSSQYILSSVPSPDNMFRHVRRYLQVYHPEAPFEVNSTDRYTLDTQEACVNARRPLHAGETIRYLSGAMLLLTDEEEEALDDSSDFSVICTSRMKGTSVLLGPARFVNHDCDPNCKFITTNKDNITLMVLRQISIGEELTIMYSENYFGDNNCECLCQTCEIEARNGFAPARKLNDPTNTLTSAAIPDEMMYSFRPSRHASQWSSRTQSNSSKSESTLGGQGAVLKPELPSRKRGPTGLNSVTPPRSDGAPPSDDELQQEHKTVLPAGDLDLTPPPEGPLQQHMDNLTFNGLLIDMNQPPQHSDPTDSESDDDLSEIGEEEYQQLLEKFSPQLSLRYKNKRKWNIEEAQSLGSCTKRTKSTSYNNPEHLSKLDLPKSKRQRDADVVNPAPKRAKHTVSNPFKPATKRSPGDSALVHRVGLPCECMDCGRQFWNIETWYVPRSCKRCERHSRLYGLGWPKTFKRKNDQEVSNNTTTIASANNTWDLGPLSNSL